MGVDPSGSRRFVCVAVDGDIDFLSPVQHDQLLEQAHHRRCTLLGETEGMNEAP